jgi:predicted amidohydrolase YtcJ
MKSFLFIFLLLLFDLFVRPSVDDAAFFTPVETADVIYFDGLILTLDSSMPQAEALAIKDGTIMMVGTNEDVLMLQGAATETTLVDLNGLTVLPGFNDAHCHWFSWREHLCTAHEEEIREWPPLEDIMSNLSANGWTSISELAFGWPGDGSIEHLNNALDLEARGKLSVRVNGYWGTLSDISMFDEFNNHPPSRNYSDHIRAQGVKLYIDHPLGISDILTQEETDALVQRAHMDGWQIAAHAVNISGVEKILSAYEKVLGNENNEKYRYRIEHAVKVTDDQMNRMLKKGIIASFQLMGPPDWPAQETHINYISNTQPDLQMRWREFVDNGLPSVASTDAPFNNTTCAYNPFRVIYQGVTRKGYLDREHAQWELDQRLTISQCLKLMSIDGAYATKEENIKGNLMPGKYADFIVVSKNPIDYENNPEGLLDIEVLQTVVGGKVEFCANNPCYNLCEDIEAFDLDSLQVTTSQYLFDQKPAAAFDGNKQSNWGAGAHPPQWVQMDLLEDQAIAKINLTVSQFPNGKTVHQILGMKSAVNCDLQLIHEFNGNTSDGQVLTYKPTSPDTLRFLRILTTESPSWVSWYEIEIEYVDIMSTAVISADLLVNHFSVIPNPANAQTTVKVNLPRTSNMDLELLAIDGKVIRKIYGGERKSGRYHYSIDLGDFQPGIYFIRLRTDHSIQVRKLVVGGY